MPIRSEWPADLFPTYQFVRLNRAEGAPYKHELGLLAFLIRTVQPEHVLDIGMGTGTTALLFQETCPEAKVVTVGICRDDVPHTIHPLGTTDTELVPSMEEWVAASLRLAEKGIVAIRCDTAIFPYVSMVPQQFVFVDGAHSSEYISLDSLAAVELVSPGGMVVWHDYSPGDTPQWGDVTGFIRNLATGLDLVHFKGTSLVMYQRGGL